MTPQPEPIPRWRVSVDVRSDQPFGPDDNPRILDAIDMVDDLTAITTIPDGSVIFDFTLPSADALDALVDALGLVRSIWDEYTRIPIPALLDVSVKITSYDRRWAKATGPDVKIPRQAHQPRR